MDLRSTGRIDFQSHTVSHPELIDLDKVMIVTGLVLPTELESPAQKPFEHGYGGYSNGTKAIEFGPDTRWIKDLCGLCHDLGPMMAFRCSVFKEVGVFDIALGLPVGGAEDIDIHHRITRACFSMAYVPEALRYHRHRRDLEGLKMQLNGYGKAYLALLTKCLILEPDLRLRILKRMLGYCFVGIPKRAVLGMLGRRGLPARFVIAEGMGALQGPWAYLRSVRSVKQQDRSYNPCLVPKLKV